MSNPWATTTGPPAQWVTGGELAQISWNQFTLWANVVQKAKFCISRFNSNTIVLRPPCTTVLQAGQM